MRENRISRHFNLQENVLSHIFLKKKKDFYFLKSRPFKNTVFRPSRTTIYWAWSSRASSHPTWTRASRSWKCSPCSSNTTPSRFATTCSDRPRTSSRWAGGERDLKFFILKNFNTSRLPRFLFLKNWYFEFQEQILLNRLISHMQTDRDPELTSANQVAQVREN